LLTIFGGGINAEVGDSLRYIVYVLPITRQASAKSGEGPGKDEEDKKTTEREGIIESGPTMPSMPVISESKKQYAT
jgi:hypothetical protein